MSSDDRRKLTDEWLGNILMPHRHTRDYYADGPAGRLTIRMSSDSRPQAIFNRTVLCDVTSRAQLLALAKGLKIELEGD